MSSEEMKRLLQQHWEVWLLQVTFSEIGTKFIYAKYFRLFSLSKNVGNQYDYETMLKFQGMGSFKNHVDKFWSFLTPSPPHMDNFT